MSRRLDDLSPRFRPLAVELVARITELGIPIMIVDTLRTEGEQAANVAKGVSRVKHSKHQDGDAIDLCPYEVFQLAGPDKLAWAAPAAIWRKMGAVGEALGLRWGGRFAPYDKDGVGWDPGHFEFVEANHTEVKA